MEIFTVSGGQVVLIHITQSQIQHGQSVDFSSSFKLIMVHL